MLGQRRFISLFFTDRDIYKNTLTYFCSQNSFEALNFKEKQQNFNLQSSMFKAPITHEIFSPSPVLECSNQNVGAKAFKIEYGKNLG